MLFNYFMMVVGMKQEIVRNQRHLDKCIFMSFSHKRPKDLRNLKLGDKVDSLTSC